MLTPGQRREFVIIRDNGQDREIRLSLKQIEVGGLLTASAQLRYPDVEAPLPQRCLSRWCDGKVQAVLQGCVQQRKNQPN